MEALNPATGEAIAKVQKSGKEDVREAVEAAREAFEKGSWSGKTAGERSLTLIRLADLVEGEADRLARLESTNQGKSYRYARYSDFPFIIDNLRFFAGAARMLEGKAAAEYSGLGTSFVRREPLGVIGAVVPWNYPLYIAIWKLAPALAAGNSVVIKPASYTPLTLLEFAKLAEKAGVPSGVLNVVTGPGEVVGSELASNPDVDMIAVTGDTETGKKIMQLASSNVKRVHLELGGKAPMLVLPDADLDAAAEGAVVGGFWNTGQDCTAVTRVFVTEEQHAELVKKMVSRAKKFRIGDPLSEATDMGPMVSAKQRERVEGYIEAGIGEGAKAECGGKRPDSAELKKGFYIEPTILTGTHQKMKVCREEIFGPVIAVQTYDDLAESVARANDVVYGLAASVWGKDIAHCMKTAAALNFGTVWINDHGILVSEMPHGGFKQSGFGKDLSLYSLDEYTRIKHVYIDTSGEEAKHKAWHWTVYGSRPK
jgi:betaine-aldehyde dehydrogenase